MTSEPTTPPQGVRTAADGEGATTTAEDSTSGSDHVMDMLGEHVPLSLLMDLTAPTGPDSETILDDEGLPEDSWWSLAGGDEGGDGASGDAEDDTAGTDAPAATRGDSTR
jgi:hypothetical protein